MMKAIARRTWGWGRSAADIWAGLRVCARPIRPVPVSFPRDKLAAVPTLEVTP